MGYYLAGFRVVGVDLVRQKHYPFECHQADALEFLDGGGWKGFDAIHASPPCQGYSIMNNLPWLAGKDRAYLIQPVREALAVTGLPYVIENVMGARWGAKGLAKRGLEGHGMQAGWLCGTMFGFPFYRHRLFETNWFWLQPGHPKHQGVIKKGPLFGNSGGRLSQMVFAANSGTGIGNGPEW
ncbi:MAG TPA: DNA methylase, partial [Dehalococcoidia bacterium]|nr:DNA methylase [Dehalococcoidia bacterium]